MILQRHWDYRTTARIFLPLAASTIISLILAKKIHGYKPLRRWHVCNKKETNAFTILENVETVSHRVEKFRLGIIFPKNNQTSREKNGRN